MSKSRKFNQFKQVPVKAQKRNRFDLSHDVKMSFKMGRLYPISVLEAMPGDTFRINLESLLRFAPLVSPVMHEVIVTFHAFFTPNRILWPQFEDWITGAANVLAPNFVYDTLGVGSLGDYMKYPTGNLTTDLQVTCFPLAAYTKIWDEWYRDQNLQDEVFQELVAGENADYDTLCQGDVFDVAWMHDYFTSALPFAQKGDEVLIPLGAFNDVNVELDPVGAPSLGMLAKDFAGTILANQDLQSVGDGGLIGSPTGTRLLIDPNNNLKAITSDLEATSASINNLRLAFRTQEWLEKNARGGTRYIEFNKVHYNVWSSDKRLQRPEYIGGHKQRMTISEVLSTAQTNDGATIENPVGAYAGHGVSYGSSKAMKYFCEEHGWIHIFVNVTPVTAYQQGLHRSYFRFDNLDYPFPTFAHIGEQPILNKEIFIDPVDSVRQTEFGYIPRYSEMRFENSRVAGDFKESLAIWHLGRIFSSQPNLNADFISAGDQSNYSRIFAVQDGTDYIYAQFLNRITVTRALPQFGVPTI